MKVDSERIKQLRISKGLSQNDLAKEADLSQKIVWNMENDHGGHRPNSVLKVAGALGVSVDELAVDALPASDRIQTRSDSRPENRIEIWKQTIYDGEPESGGTIEKTDEVQLERLGDYVVRATILRKDPPTGAEYEFLGRHAEGMIYGHYWRIKGQGSSGVLLLRETGPHAKFFRGLYTKIRRDILTSGVDTLSISNIVLDWTFEGVQDQPACTTSLSTPQ